LNDLTENPFEILNKNSNNKTNIINKSLITFLSKNFLCNNFSNVDFLILSIINNLIKEIKIQKQSFSFDIFSLCINYIVKSKLKSFYQIEKSEINYDNKNNITNQSIKFNNNINSANTTMNLNSPSIKMKNNEKINNLKLIDSKFPYFLSLTLQILGYFFNNSNEEINVSKTILDEKNKKILSIKIGQAIKISNNNTSENIIFNPIEGESFDMFYLFLEKVLFFFKEIMNREIDIINKLIKANINEFTENDFNEKICIFYIKAEINTLTDIFNFIYKIINFKRMNKQIKNKLVYFFFKNIENILLLKIDKIDNPRSEISFNDKTLNNYYLTDESFVISLLSLMIDLLAQQYNSKIEELFDDISKTLELNKILINYVSKNKDGIIKMKNKNKISLLIEKGNKLIIFIEEKIKQKRIIDEVINIKENIK